MADEIDVQKGWTLAAYVAHNEALRVAEVRFQDERDRRYSEVNLEREKALAIKQEADKTALALQAETQQYKDEKANLLREQINSERGLYATKEDLVAAVRESVATIKPLADFVTSQQGRQTGVIDARTLLFAVIGALIGGAGLVLAFLR